MGSSGLAFSVFHARVAITRSTPARAAQRACTRPIAAFPRVAVLQVISWAAATMIAAIAMDQSTTMVAEPRCVFGLVSIGVLRALMNIGLGSGG